jgi:hypothetical protein
MSDAGRIEGADPRIVVPALRADGISADMTFNRTSRTPDVKHAHAVTRAPARKKLTGTRVSTGERLIEGEMSVVRQRPST